MDTVSRFKEGVHSKQNCGRNRNGYAAITSASQCTDLHKLGKSMMSSSLTASSDDKKKSFACSDTLAYILLKSIYYKGLNTTYILLLSSGPFISTTVTKMLLSIVEMHNLVAIVQKIDREFSVTVMCKGIKLLHTLDSEQSLLSFFLSIKDFEDSSVIIYPKVNDIYREIVVQCKISSWCTPLSRSEVYVSKHDTGEYFHNVFPWSKYPSYSGFTLGNGSMQLGSTADRQRYIGAFNFYESMISSIPLQSSCTDCNALKNMGIMISMLIYDNHKVHKHTVSSSSIEALEEIKRKIHALQDQV